MSPCPRWVPNCVVASDTPKILCRCALHTSPVPTEALTEYWSGLPEEHRGMLFQLREEDFCAELDANLRYQLRICRECRFVLFPSFSYIMKAAKLPNFRLSLQPHK